MVRANYNGEDVPREVAFDSFTRTLESFRESSEMFVRAETLGSESCIKRTRWAQEGAEPESENHVVFLPWTSPATMLRYEEENAGLEKGLGAALSQDFFQRRRMSTCRLQ